MPDKLKRTLVGAAIAVALAAAVSYGVISQQTADRIQTEANQALTEGRPDAAPRQPPSPETRNPVDPQPAPEEPAPPNPSAPAK